MELSGRSGRDHVGVHAHAASRFTADRHLSGIAAELPDVSLHPAQHGLLIQQAVVARAARALGGQRRMREPAERTETIVERDDDEVAFDECLRVEAVAGATQEGPGVYPDQYGILAQ